MGYKYLNLPLKYIRCYERGSTLGITDVGQRKLAKFLTSSSLQDGNGKGVDK